MVHARGDRGEDGGCDICESGLFIFDWGWRTPGGDQVRQLNRTLSAQLFHQDCGKCNADEASTGKDSDICAFCRHLRLRHLLRCVDPDEPPVEGTFVKLCRVEDIPERVASCSFCHLVVRAALPYRYFSGIASPADFSDGVVAFSVGRELLQTRVDYPVGWDGGRTIHFDDELSETKQPRKMVDDNPSDSTWCGAIRPPQAKALVGSHVNWSLALRWLEDCRTNHDNCTRERVGSLPIGFRLVDVNRRCVVEAQANCQFVALSYVWGQHPDPTKLFATRSRREGLKVDDSLSALDLPKTVEDAIEACKRLGEGYLWIDRLCIIQDDLEDKGNQIDAMAAIYSLAKFALIVTDGDSDSGVAGISRERKQAQMRDQISGFAFINEPAGWREIIGGDSIWSTRGWTYQEAVLPQRKLYLSESQAFFECATHVADECGYLQQAMYSPHGLNEQPWNNLYATFYGHLARYRVRSLTNPGDVYNAIDGVASALYGGFHSLLSGLPRQEFDEALLWCLDGHTDSTLRGAAANGSSPSWSWSSTDREITLLDSENRRGIRYCDTLAAWSRLNQNGKSVESVRIMPGGKPLSHFQAEQDSCGCCRDKFNAKKDAESLLFPVVAWSQGCINRPCPFPQPHETTFAATRAEIRARWPCRHRYWLEALQDVATSHAETNIPPSPSPSPSPSTPGASTVFASVQSAFFRLQGSVRTNETSGRIFNDLCIARPDGKPAGLLIAGDPGLGLEPEIIAGSMFEFIALSIGASENIVLPDGRVKSLTKWDMGSPGDIEEEEEDEFDSVCSGSRPGSEQGTQSEGEGSQHEEEIPLGVGLEREMDAAWSQPDLGDACPQPAPGPESWTEPFPEPEPYLRSGAEPVVAAEWPSDQNSQAPAESEPIPSDGPEDESCKSFISLEELRKLTFRDGEGRFLHPLPVVNVMMVERTGEKSVRRISVGWIYLTSWVSAEPMFGTVFLE